MSWLSDIVGKIPVVGGAINAIAKPVDAIARGAIGNIPGGSAILGAGDALGRAIPTPGTSGVLAGALGAAGVGNGGGSISPAVLALAAAQAANSASLGKQANDYSDKAWNLANDSYTSRAGLRDLGIKGLTNNAKPDLSSLSAIRAQNPVAAKAGVGNATPQIAPPIPPPSTTPVGSGLPLAPPSMRTDGTPSLPGGGLTVLPEMGARPTHDVPAWMAPPGGGSRITNTQGLRSALRPMPRTDGGNMVAL